ncbi:tRNA (uracil-5-)-methyltransferase homolog A [Coccinella septempunctata]|uniref:tRNA (uracil-5-)-methyltransferase homolog A n=1 Tax=Coccinella septempunctata TaxID=41139 RepID=UPI001D072C32|nr:tRNA (uracil-5-)-methyltransferase homolog A [Coccinella septempunctata]
MESEKTPTCETEKAVENNSDDPFAYLNRHFSNEQFKIVLRNLPAYYGISEFKKLLNDKLKLNSRKIKQANRNARYAFICFRNEEDRENAIKVLTGYSWKGKVLEVLKAKPSADPFVLKRSQENDHKDGSSKKFKNDKASDNRTPEERVKESTIPLADIPYNDQLKLKEQNIRTIIEKLGKELLHSSPELRLWITKQKLVNNGLICPIEVIKHADKIDGYRNKCDFSFGIDEETKLPVVGFRLSSYAHGSISVGPVENLRHIPNEMKKLCKVFENFVQQSKLEVFNAEIQCGHFRQLTVRLADKQLMIIVGIHPQNLSEEELKDFKGDLVEYFSNGPGKDTGVTSLYYETIVKKTSQNDYFPPEHLWGATHNYENILGLKFKISPEAFFQINTQAVEILYKTAIDLAETTEKTTILDVCCGTGTIGLCFAKYCGQVLGIEIIAKAIADAKENAVLNNIENANFFVGKAEETLGSICYKSKNEEIIAVLDPPRAGLHQKAILQLRKVKKIKRLIYVSCNPEAARKNFFDLGRPESKTLQGEPFVPVKAVPVDMFPHTKHCELVILFERFDIVRQRAEKLNLEENEKKIEMEEKGENAAEKLNQQEGEKSEVKQEKNGDEIVQNIENLDSSDDNKLTKVVDEDHVKIMQ